MPVSNPRRASCTGPARGPLAIVAALASTLLLGACAAGAGGTDGIVDGSGSTLGSSGAIDSDAPSLAGDYLAGRFALDSGDLHAATASFQRALEAAPDNVELRRQVFLLQLATGDIEAALVSGEQLSALDPETDEVDLLFALRDAKAGDFASSQRRFEALAPRGLTGLAAPLLDAWAMFGQGNVEGGLRRLRAGSDEDGLGPLRRYNEALMLRAAGRRDEALLLLRGEIKPETPAASRVVETLAAFEVESGNRDRAVKLLEDQIALTGEGGALSDMLVVVQGGGSPDVPVTDATSGMADALLGVAEAVSQQRAGPQGLFFARLAAYLAPQRGDVWLLIGRIEQLQENDAEAARAYATVPRSSPYSWEARLAEADAMAASGQTDAAVERLRAMAAEQPTRTDALRQLGDLYRRNERFADAARAYGEAIERLAVVEPEDWRLFYSNGIALERLDRWSEAEASLLRALELAPDQPLVLNYLGYSWVDQGVNLERGQEMLVRAVELRPQDGFIVDSLGWAYFKLGEFDKAVEALERAVELEPGDPVINDHLGDAYWRVGREREARFQWQRALVLKPEEDEIAAIESKLQRGLPAVTGAGRG
ncbi:MAG: tetratricopeptide repeat protein [Geminicoccaceae bacterium]